MVLSKHFSWKPTLNNHLWRRWLECSLLFLLWTRIIIHALQIKEAVKIQELASQEYDTGLSLLYPTGFIYVYAAAFRGQIIAVCMIVVQP